MRAASDDPNWYPDMSNRNRILLTCCAAVVLLGVLWKEVIEDRVFPKRWGVVEEAQIYRSGQLHPALVERTLQQNEIDLIINMNQWRLDKPAQAAEEAAADALGLEKARYPMMGDGTGDPENYVQAVAHLHRAAGDGQRVLVHCTAGAQRTGAVIALYRTLLQGWSVDDAIDEMEHYNFDRQDDVILLDYLETHMAYIVGRLQAEGVVGELPTPLPSFSS